MEPAILLSAYQARPLLEARAKGRERIFTTTDLGRTKQEVALTEAGVVFNTGETVSWLLLEETLEEERRVFLVEAGKLVQVQIYSEATGWVRSLCPTTSAPTVLISGIPMHRIKNTDPITDTNAKMKALGAPPRGRLLDTATGLGYTAIAAAKSAKEVVTIELDPAALEIARMNPWSRELFEKGNIRQIVGDAFEEVEQFATGYFSDVLHDPPTMALGGELYSEEFYRRLHRITARGGRLFHYIGDPSSAHGKKMYPGVMKRLGAAGFKKIVRHEQAYGLTAIA